MVIPPRRKTLTLAYGALLLTLIVWGVAPVFIQSFSVAAGPADALVIRMCLTGLCCLIIWPFYGSLKIAHSDWPRLLLVAVVGMFGYYAFTIYGFAVVPAGIGGMIMATQPLLIALLTAVVYRVRIGLLMLIGLVVSFLGTIYLLWGGVSLNPAHPHLLSGALLILVAGIFWAIYVVFSKPLILTYGAFKFVMLVSLLCAVASLGFASASTFETLQGLDRAEIFSLLYLSVIGSLGTGALWNFSTAHLSTSTVGTSLYVIPVVSVIAGVLLLHESVSASLVIASAVILSGVALSQFASAKGL